MTMILKTMDGNRFEITDQEYQNLNATSSQLAHFPSINTVINKNRIESIYPKSTADDVEARKVQQTGVLHDGTKVIRRFGEWVVAGETAIDDIGNYVPIKLNKDYSPEVARDCVATEAEYKKVLAGEKYYELVGYNPERNKRESAETKSIGDIIKSKQKRLA